MKEQQQIEELEEIVIEEVYKNNEIEGDKEIAYCSNCNMILLSNHDCSKLE
jgi:hypothetical protein